MLVWGGAGDSDQMLSYDPVTDTWVQTHSDITVPVSPLVHGLWTGYKLLMWAEPPPLATSKLRSLDPRRHLWSRDSGQNVHPCHSMRRRRLVHRQSNCLERTLQRRNVGWRASIASGHGHRQIDQCLHRSLWRFSLMDGGSMVMIWAAPGGAPN